MIIDPVKKSNPILKATPHDQKEYKLSNCANYHPNADNFNFIRVIRREESRIVKFIYVVIVCTSFYE